MVGIWRLAYNGAGWSQYTTDGQCKSEECKPENEKGQLCTESWAVIYLTSRKVSYPLFLLVFALTTIPERFQIYDF